jgi:hypothetical protein
MLLRVLKFVRLPLFLILIFAVIRFMMGVNGTPYTPRSNAASSIVVAYFISCFYFGALSGRVGGLGWGGTVLVGLIIGLFSQILIFTASLVSFMAHINASYFINWDNLNLPEGTVVTMEQVLRARAGGLVFGPIPAIVLALIGRVLGVLAPNPSVPESVSVRVK